MYEEGFAAMWGDIRVHCTGECCREQQASFLLKIVEDGNFGLLALLGLAPNHDCLGHLMGEPTNLPS